MKIFRLSYAFHMGYLREDLVQEMKLIQQFDTDMWIGAGKDLLHLFPDAFGAHYVNLGCKPDNGLLGITMNGKLKSACEAHCPYHTQLIFSKSHNGISDRSDYPLGNIFPPAGIIKDLIRYRIVKQAIYGKISSFDILLWGAKGYIIRMTSITVRTFCAEGSYLKGMTIFGNNDHSELSANRNSFFEEFHDVLWRGAGSDIIVGRFLSHNHIAHTATRKKGFITALL
ncbi:MAG: hypothetical protein BROFUL_00275 [Candidatus Brocadia fulgida]|uniref:Uncharacterized protein n=1 Tax=Candidatus Brocadia fulgida TaxID=380242 RepID=A0A0M2UYU3_9BACT|nr:MAG: hypothetical protein BROFUL_00275 [Candidatus Brocadia fulgida]